MKPKIKLIKQFISLEASAGLLLLAAAAISLALANSSFSYVNEQMESMHYFIDDGLMVFFFLLVGIEIKRERLEGHLKKKEQCLLPAIAAMGGVIVPAVIFWFFNRGDAEAVKGWAIPTATDIAFALCIMQLLGKHIPHSLKITLVTIAIVDDIIAVVIIALFYTKNLDMVMLAGAAAIVAVLMVINYYKVRSLSLYLMLGVVLWWLVLNSGIHATIAGVLLAFTIPLEVGRNLENRLHPVVAYGIMPLFAFANAGVSLEGISWGMFENNVTLGIAAGLILGKPIGVLIATLIATGLKISKIPHEVRWSQYVGMSILCGIGFTMSLFIGGLSYHDDAHHHAMRLGVLTGSVVSALIGYAVLRMLKKKPARIAPSDNQA